MFFGNQRARGGGLDHGPSDAQGLGFFLERASEAIHEFALDVDAFRAKTDLAGIEEDSVGQATHCFLEIAVGKNDGSVLAAQFKRYRLHRGSDGTQYGSARAGFTREGDRVYSGVRGEEFSG